MAELTKAQLQEQLAALKEDNKRLGDDVAKKNAALAKAAKKTPEIVPISGSAKVKWQDIEGETVSKTVSFKDGQINVRLNGGNVVKSEAFLKIVNGKKLTEKEKIASPALAGLTKEDANKWLARLARLEAKFLDIK